MPSSHAYIERVNELLKSLDSDPSAKLGIELANEILVLVGVSDVKSTEDVFESSMELPNSERYDRWFQPHPIFKSDRACFELAESEFLQGKFYWLQKHSRQIVAGGVHFTPNFEDEDFTRNENYKVGIDFFLSPSGRSLQIVLSNRGNLRVVELNKRLNNTQIDIFTKWDNAGSLSSREALHATLWDSFKLKSVNQKFYDGVANSFNELLQYLKSIDKDDEEAKLFASRLLGRLLFCWFLRKKNIIDESIGYFDTDGMDSTKYYKSNLERLFFLTLNTPVDERDELQKQHQQQLIHLPAEDKQPSLFKIDQKTPFLNGGLFEPHENDWFNDESLTLPEGFFVNLYNHFEEFNFTTDESSPEYEQIAIDPEMLGRVFESLLATQIDETGQQARKAKGAFYTPREIVSYMCRESLRNHLQNASPDDERYKKAINDLLNTSDREWAAAGTNSKRDSVPKEYRRQVIDALDATTILDPACGSGAFPMGMLQLCLRTYERLESRFDPYLTKLKIIENNIFGVDIEPMAVEISRLRAWLSLIVDEQEGRQIEPLPNLDFKFVCANSLVPLDDSEIDMFNDHELHQKLADIRTRYFNARKPHTKKELQKKYYKLKNAASTLFDNLRTKQLKSFDPFRNSYPSEFFDTDQMFGVSGFDIIIGNPPYGETVDLNTKSFRAIYKSTEGKFEIYKYFMERALILASPKGTIALITPATWLTLGYFNKIRRIVLTECSILQISNTIDKAFDSATVNTVVFILKKGQTSNKTLLVSDELFTKTEINNFYDSNFLINLEKKDAVIDKLDSLRLSLGSQAEVTQGLIAYASRKQDRSWTTKTKESDLHKKILYGREISRYSINWQGDYLKYGDWLHRKRPDYVFEKPKIFIQRIRNPKLKNRLIAALDYDGFLATNGLSIVLAADGGPSIELITGILNSKLINYWFGFHYKDVNIKPAQLRTIPMPDNISASIATKIVNKVNEVSKSNNYNTESQNTIDDLVIDLYGMTSEEVSIMDERND